MLRILSVLVAVLCVTSALSYNFEEEPKYAEYEEEELNNLDVEDDSDELDSLDELERAPRELDEDEDDEEEDLEDEDEGKGKGKKQKKAAKRAARKKAMKKCRKTRRAAVQKCVKPERKALRQCRKENKKSSECSALRKCRRKARKSAPIKQCFKDANYKRCRKNALEQHEDGEDADLGKALRLCQKAVKTCRKKIHKECSEEQAAFRKLNVQCGDEFRGAHAQCAGGKVAKNFKTCRLAAREASSEEDLEEDYDF